VHTDDAYSGDCCGDNIANSRNWRRWRFGGFLAGFGGFFRRIFSGFFAGFGGFFRRIFGRFFACFGAGVVGRLSRGFSTDGLMVTPQSFGGDVEIPDNGTFFRAGMAIISSNPSRRP
jgi:hypothetical protein